MPLELVNLGDYMYTDYMYIASRAVGNTRIPLYLVKSRPRLMPN